ncbi:hypothetical protein [Arthrobacter mobilis]|uniref:Uncharacterized protein n=1 Tax=Arthrobacter mobilis TaxID=2724944 RepID=A0A7X6HD87_9MICC|nr:hypothetical protein [Arthrobacter mobilis]NKX54390.1 hypothetical protein [Arthrobacter mobilis]
MNLADDKDGLLDLPGVIRTGSWLPGGTQGGLRAVDFLSFLSYRTTCCRDLVDLFRWCHP